MTPRATGGHRRRCLPAILALALAAGCGKDDDSGPSPEDSAPDGATASTSAGGALADNDARDSLLDAVGGDADLEDAIAALPAERRYGIVADQLDPAPEVQIEGRDIRLVFDEGSVRDAVIQCILATATQTATETVTLVYPDGDEVC